MIERIIVSGDFLRPRVEGNVTYNFHEKRINKYYDFFKYQLEMATELPVEKLNTDNTEINPAVFYDFCGLKYSDDKEWLKIYDNNDISEECLEYFNSFIKNSIVIYIEMPLILKKMHNILSIPYIDLTVHPIRFLDDHMFGFSTNNKSVFDRIKLYQVDERLFYMQANMIKAIVEYNPLPIEKNSVLIAGQTNVDKALYSNGRCLSIMDFESEIEKMGREYECVYYKAHPFNKELSNIHKFLKKYDFVKLCPSDWNTYKMLANPNLRKVYAITSGVLYEAKYFEKESESLYKSYLHLDYNHNCEYSEETYLSIYNDFINPIFWKNILQDVVETNELCPNINLEFRPNRVRATFNDYWAYTELDPTIITTNKKFGEPIRSLQREINGKLNDNENLQMICSQVDSIDAKLSQLDGNINILKMNPCFEKNIIRRQVKRIVFQLSQKSVFWNGNIVLAKLKSEAAKYADNSDNVSAIKGITYRPHAPHGGRGGGGAVLSAMQSILGNKVGNYDITYNYSEKDGVWHTLKNRYYSYTNYERFINPKSHLLPLYAAIAFVIDKTKNEKGKLYICHEYATAYALSLLNKKYIMVLHTQGTRVDEKIALGEPLTKHEMNIINSCEKKAMRKAQLVCFPSKGAEKMFFDSKYCNVKKEEINLGPCLYNTVYASPKLVPNNILKDESVLTFISVGTLTNAKGQDRVCDWFEKFLKEYNGNVRWICIGKGPLEKNISGKIQELKNTFTNFDAVILKNVPFATVQYLYSISNVYIMRHRISVFDLATLEAMKNGCALVLSEVGGNIEYNVDENVIYDKDYTLLLDDEKIIKLQEKNRQVYNEYFSKQKFKERYENVILNCCDSINRRG